jgi:hypothetical protein
MLKTPAAVPAAAPAEAVNTRKALPHSLLTERETLQRLRREARLATRKTRVVAELWMKLAPATRDALEASIEASIMRRDSSGSGE